VEAANQTRYVQLGVGETLVFQAPGKPGDQLTLIGANSNDGQGAAIWTLEYKDDPAGDPFKFLMSAGYPSGGQNFPVEVRPGASLLLSCFSAGGNILIAFRLVPAE